MALACIADLNGPQDEVVRRIKQAKTLSDMYDDFLMLEQEDEVDDRPPGIHASELYPCLRKTVYSILGVPKKNKIPKFWKQRFKIGHATHHMLQDDFHRMAKRSQKGMAMRLAETAAEEMDCILEFQEEVRVGPDTHELAHLYNIRSHCDGIFTFRDRQTGVVVLRVGLEIKTESPDGYEKLRAPKEEHLRQTIVYMAILDLPLLWFFYMNKGNQNNTNSSAPYLIVFQPTIWNEIQERCTTALQAASTQTLPDRTEGIWCEFCPWSYECKPNNANVFQGNQQPGKRELF